MPSPNRRQSPSAVALALAAAAVLVYAGMWLGYRLQWAWLTELDSSALTALHDYGVRHPGWVRFWDVLCTVFSPAAFRFVGAVGIVVAVLRRKLRIALFMLASIEVSGVVAQIAKDVADRPRPSTALTSASSSAFPSGHAVGVMVAVLALLTMSAGLLDRRQRTVAVVVGALIVIAVGAGRVVLNVHHPSDVLAGWALGYLWFLACVVVIRPVPWGVPAPPGPAVTDEAKDETPEAHGSGH